jgi:hypothetical protein
MTEQPMRLNEFGGQQRRNWKLIALIGALLLVALAVSLGVAFGDDDRQPAASQAAAAATTGAPSVAPRRFETPQALVTYLDSRGHTCSRYEAVQGATGAVARGRCYVGATEVTVGVYAIHSDAEAQWQLIAGTMKGILPVYMVIGENWTIGGPEAWARQVADTMGAEFRAQP